MRRLIALFVVSGCSFAFVSGPPDNHAQLPYFNCTDSRVVPVLDTIWTALMVADVIALGVQNDADWARSAGCTAGDPNCPAISRHGAMTLDAVLGLAGAAGMVYGYSKTAQCRQAKAEQMARQQPYGPQPYGPMPGSWPPPQGGQPGQPGTWPPPQGGQPGQPGTWPPPQGGYPPPQGSYPPPAPPPAPAPQPAPVPQP